MSKNLLYIANKLKKNNMFMTVTTITLRTTLSLSLLATAATAVAAEPADSVATDSIAAIEKAMSKKLDEVNVEGKTH